MYADFFAQAHQLSTQGRAFVTALVVRAEKPTSARPGDKAIVTEDGVLHGWVGGNCAQPTVIEEAKRALADGAPRLLRLSPDPASSPVSNGVVARPMTCYSGGTLEIYIEPHLPPPHLLVVGSSPVAQVLTRLGKVMNYGVTVVDPELKADDPHEADAVIREINNLAAQITPQTYIVVATHGQFDELALHQALRSPAAYIALVASKARSAAVCDYLVAQGLTASELARIKVPAGLDIHAQGGDEIALSIMAEIVQTRRTTQSISDAPPTQQRAALRPVNIDLLLVDAEPSLASATAIDPVCGMTVEIASAHYRSEYAGQHYYFCAAGCKLAFDQAPETFVRLASPIGQT